MQFAGMWKNENVDMVFCKILQNELADKQLLLADFKAVEGQYMVQQRMNFVLKEEELEVS